MTISGRCPFCNTEFTISYYDVLEGDNDISTVACCHFKDTKIMLDRKVKVNFTITQSVYVDMD